MKKTIEVVLTINIDGDDLKSNIGFENLETLGDIVSVGTALQSANDIVKNQLRKFLDQNGDVPKSHWETIPASKVMLCEVDIQITEET